MNDLLRPAMYEAWHGILPVSPRALVAPCSPADVVGPVCETGDTFARDRALPALDPGALVAILDAGAYGAAMSSTYNMRPLAAEVLVDGARFAVVRDRQDHAALLAGVRVPPWLENTCMRSRGGARNAASLERRRLLARAALLWEAVWPRLWPALGLLGGFLVLALLGLPPLLPGAWHLLLLAGVAGGARLPALARLPRISARPSDGGGRAAAGTPIRPAPPTAGGAGRPARGDRRRSGDAGVLAGAPGARRGAAREAPGRRAAAGPAGARPGGAARRAGLGAGRRRRGGRRRGAGTAAPRPSARASNGRPRRPPSASRPG